MNTYLIEATPAGNEANGPMDVYTAAVVCAPDATTARKTAQREMKDTARSASPYRGQEIWTTTVLSTCTRLGTYGGRKQVPFVVLSQFHGV